MNEELIKQHLDKIPEILKRDLNQNLCVCNDVLKIDIIKSIIEGANTVEEVRKITYATDGNGCCERQVKQLIECFYPTELE